LASCDKALQIDPRLLPALISRGNALHDLERNEEALESYDLALKINPNLPDNWVNRGTALHSLERYAEALTCFDKALAVNPNHARAWTNRGATLVKLSRREEALANIDRALSLDPDFVDNWLNRGTALDSLHRHAEALASFEAGLAIAPDHPEMQLYLCRVVYSLSLAEREAAVAHAQRLLATHGDKPLMQRGLSGLVGLRADVASDREYSRALFDKFAEGFDKTLSELGYLPMVRAIVAALELEEHAALDILDAGCGTGLCAEFLKPAARALTGVDISPKMLQRAKTRGAYDRLECGDAVAFMEANGAAFDVILSSDVLDYLGDSEAFLRAAHHALRPRGKLAISAERLETDTGDAAQVGFVLAPSGRYQHSRAYLETAFADAGFRLGKVIESVMRHEVGKPVPAWIVVGERAA
jgi:predicted TPR repeat methyltransferase